MPIFHSCAEDIICILQKISTDKNLIHVVRLKDHMQVCGLQAHPSVGHFLISVLLELGQVFNAHEVFDRMPRRNESLWNSLISGYFKHQEFRHLLIVYKQIKEGSQHLDGYTFVILLKACAFLEDMEIGHELHSRISSVGLLEDNVFVCSALIDMYVKCGCIMRAQQVFDKLSVQTVVIWNTLITGYIECGCCDKVFYCFQQMQYEGISPDDVTYICILKACSNLGWIDNGAEVYIEVSKKGLEKEVVVGSTVVDMYAKSGCLTEACEVFGRIPNHNVILWNVLITGCQEYGYDEDAYRCFRKMEAERVSPNAITLNCMLKTCARLDDIAKCREVHDVIVTKGLETCLEVGSALVEMYSKVSCIDVAKDIFEKLAIRDVISWNTLIAACLEQDHSKEAIDYFEKMQLHGLSPDSFTLVLILKACDDVKDVTKLQKINIEIAIKGLERDIYVGNTLIEVYARCGLLLEAREVLERFPSRALVSWNVLITGYLEHGWHEEALRCFENLKDSHNFMDDITFVLVLKACCSVGDVISAQEIHADIIRRGCLERDAFPGSALVDMYAKCGFLSEAQNVFENLPVRDEVSWIAMIRAYTDYDKYEDAFNLFVQMRTSGISHSSVTLVCILKVIGGMNAIYDGQEIHMELIQKGMLEEDSFLRCGLIEMYSKCSAFADAQNVFDMAPVHDGNLWTTYIEYAGFEETIRCYDKIQCMSFLPLNVSTFIFTLQACANGGNMVKGQEIHAEIFKRGLDNELVLSNTLIYMYAKCGLVEESQKLLNNSPVRDKSSFQALIVGFLESGHGKEAVYWHNQLQTTSCPLGSGTYICSLKACGSIRAITEGQVLHDEITKKGLESEILVANILVDMYVKCGSLEEGRDIFDNLPLHNILSWNVLISGYVEYDNFEEAMVCIKKMRQGNIPLDCITFVSIIKMSSSMRSIVEGREIHAEVVKKGLEREPIIGNTLIDMYAKCFSLPDAQEVFDKIPHRSVIACTAITSGYVECGQSEEAMDRLRHMQNEGLLMGIPAFICGLKACRELRDHIKGRELHVAIIKRGLLDDEVFIGSILVDLYVHCGLPSDAQLVFDRLPVRDVVSWTVLIIGCTEHGNAEDALHYFDEMKRLSINRDAIILVCSLKACTNMGALEKGQEIHAEILEKGLERGDFVRETLVDLYAKCGLLCTAQGVFGGLSVKDLELWNALIAGYAQLGDYKNVCHVFERMVGEGVEPNSATFLHILSACSHAGLVAEGLMVFEAMNKHGKVKSSLDHLFCGVMPNLDQFSSEFIMPTLDHVSCIVDILGRAGCIDHVLYIIDGMPFHPDNVIWLTLLGACKKWGNVEHGRLAFDHAIRLKEKDVAAYVCMSNIYADAAKENRSGSWEDNIFSQPESLMVATF